MLSVVIVAWNEERNLPRVVASVRSLADEIIVVVDEASVDKTLEVAKKLKIKVFTHPHMGIVEPMRNWSITKASGDWILLLDADEEVTASLADKIVKEIKSDKHDYFRVPRQNIIFNKWIKSDHWWPDYVYRLFKKGSVSWDDSIHSLPITRGNGGDFPAEEKYALLHHHYDSISQYVEPHNRYTDHQLKQLVEAGYSFKWTDILTKPYQEFLRQYFARKGYTQGLHGLALSLLQAVSELVLYLKAWQVSDFVPTEVKMEEFEKEVSQLKPQARWWIYQAKIDTSPLPITWWWKIVRKIGL